MKKNIFRKIVGDKKGSGVNLLVSVVIAILFVVVVVIVFILPAADQGTSAFDMLKDGKSDFDGDGLPNSLDPCACGTVENPREDNWKITINSSVYCVSGYDQQTCSNLSWPWLTVSGRDYCMYTNEMCLNLRKKVAKESAEKK